MKRYKHLSVRERVSLFKGRQEGYSLRDIAKALGRNPGTISRELKRNSFESVGYLPDTAEYKSKSRRGYRERHPLKSPEIYDYVIEKLKKLWSPEQIHGRIRIDLPGRSIGAETIYAYIYGKEAKKLKLYQYLRLARKKRRLKYGRNTQRALISNRTWITERGREIDTRSTIGHWEADSMLFSKQKSALFVQLERHSRYAMATKMRRKTAEQVKRIYLSRFSTLPYDLRKSSTVDNGTEFVAHLEITEKLEHPFYFCHPYASWEKGSVENTNGLIRQYLPLCTNIWRVPQRTIDKIINQINNRPRKCLGFQTPKEIFCDALGVALQN